MRRVSSNKEMFRATFPLPADYAYQSREQETEVPRGDDPAATGAGATVEEGGERDEAGEMAAKRLKRS
jgi:hypothetical protein